METVENNSNSLLTSLYHETLNLLAERENIHQLRVERVVVGLFFTAVKLDNGAGGLAATPVKSIPSAVCCTSSAKALPSPGKLRGKSVHDILHDLHCAFPLRKAIAIAVLNALIETVWRNEAWRTTLTIGNTADAFELLDIPPQSRVALVGAFPPYIRELRKRSQPFKILELDPSVLKEAEMPYFAPASSAPEVIPWADIVISTGTTLINDSLDPLLALARRHTQFAVIGPTTPLLPAPFQQRGVTVAGGCRVTAIDELLDLLSEGASGYHFFGKSVERISLVLPRRVKEPL